MSICSPRLTASLLKLHLHPSNKNTSHRVLTTFVKRVTGATITDARDLEDEEGDIPNDLMERIHMYAPLSSVQRVFKGDNGDSYSQLSFSLIQSQLIYTDPYDQKVSPRHYVTWPCDG